MHAPGDENSADLRGRLAVRPVQRSDSEALMRLLTQLHPAYPPDPRMVEVTHGGRPWAVVENVVVDEARRQQGIGRALLDEIDALTKAAGCYMVQLLSLNHRREAHSFYASLGYAPVARGFRRYLEGFGPTGEST